MTKRKHNQNSSDAYKSLQPEQLRKMYTDIVWALGQMPEGGSFEDLALVLKVKEAQIWRRLNEVEVLGLIERGGRKMLSSGRYGTLWKLPDGKKITTAKHPTGKAAHQFAASIIHQSKLF